MTTEHPTSLPANSSTDDQRELGHEFISGLGMPPVEFVHLACELGSRAVSVSPRPLRKQNPYGLPAWSLRTDTVLRRALRGAVEGTGIRITTGEYFLAGLGRDLEDRAADMDVMCDIGAERLVLINLENDPACASGQCARFVEMTTARGVGALLEYLPGDSAISNLSSALNAVCATGSPDFRVVVDAMHFYSSGSSAAELAAADPSRIGHVQLCDLPPQTTAASADYGRQALNDRLPPGQGHLPLADFVAGVPRGATIGLELPMMSEARIGTSVAGILAPAVGTSRRLLATVKQ